MQGGEDDEGLYGFLPKDIKAEVSRTKKLVSKKQQRMSANYTKTKRRNAINALAFDLMLNKLRL